MHSIDKTVGQRLRVQYIFALSMVAILTILGQFLIQTTLSHSLNDAHTINLAGRQRMLSQKMVKNILVLRNYKLNDTIKNNYLKEIEIDLKVWQKNHQLLSSITLSNRIGLNNKIEYDITNKYNDIMPYFQELKFHIEKILKGETADFDDAKIISSSQQFLKRMDAIVYTYDNWSTKQVEIIRKFEWILLFLTLATLLVEVMIIFTPLINYVKDVISRLSQSEEKQIEINNQLRFSNRMLLQTQEKLQLAIKEKYQLQIKEEEEKTAALLKGQEEERRRMSREMHDGVGQILTGIKLVSGKLKSFNKDKEPKYNNLIENLGGLINDAIESTRMVSFDLMPPVLVDYGLIAAIKLLGEKIESLYGIKVVYEISVFSKRFNDRLEINLYRIIQEALNNSIKHAKATIFIIKIIESEDFIYLETDDNGIGFKIDDINIENQSVIHNGLLNMKTRTQLLGGTIKITSVLNKGTNIFLKLPKS